MPKRKMKLGMFLRPGGHHIAAWRHPLAQADAGVNFPHFVEMAQIAERGLFDLLFSADSHTVYTTAESAIERVHYCAWMEPYTLLSALSGYTKNIGLVCTATTSFEQPYSVARRFATLDLITGGRSGWNMVTSGNEAEVKNFSKDPTPPKAERYKRGREFVEVVQRLWDSWDEDAFVRDKQTGIFFDRSKMHVLNHHGSYYDVEGPLNVARSPQGRPVLVQAGASDDGRQLAAEVAEVVFTAADSVERACQFYKDVKSRMVAVGRVPDHLKILPGLLVVVAPTRNEAESKFQLLQDLVHPELGLALMSRRFGHDLSKYALDEPLPPLAFYEHDSRSELIKSWAENGTPTLRQLYQRFASSRGHSTIVGTPSDVADYMVNWLEMDACDGFNILPPYFNGGLLDFVDLVVPELQRRGVYRRAYEGTTLRENLGLPVPRNRYGCSAEAVSEAVSTQ